MERLKTEGYKASIPCQSYFYSLYFHRKFSIIPCKESCSIRREANGRRCGRHVVGVSRYVEQLASFTCGLELSLKGQRETWVLFRTL